MIFELKCKKCGTLMIYDTSVDKTDRYKTCTNCENILYQSTEARLDNISYLEDFEVLSIKREFRDSIFDRNIESIRQTYENATDEEKKKLDSFIGRIEFLIQSDNTVEQLYDVVNKLYDEIIPRGESYIV